MAESVEGEHIRWATCTSPLVFPTVYRQSIEKYWEALKAGYDSLVSFERIKRYLWNEEGPINYELGLKHVLSQQLPDFSSAIPHYSALTEDFSSHVVRA